MRVLKTSQIRQVNISKLQGAPDENMFFFLSQPIPCLHIAASYPLSSQHNVSAGPVQAREWWQNTKKSWKKTNFPAHLVDLTSVLKGSADASSLILLMSVQESRKKSCDKCPCYRVFRKNCVFFTIHYNPSLAYIAAVRDRQSSQRNASVQSILLAGNFLYNQ